MNTDGEPFVFHTLTFRVGSAQVAFDALASLAWGATKDDLKAGAEWNVDGSLRTVEFDWIGKGNRIHKTWDNTILGHLNISGQTLTVEVNSANRAKKIREQIEKRLGIHATHLSTTSQTPEENVSKTRETTSGRASLSSVRQNRSIQNCGNSLRQSCKTTSEHGSTQRFLPWAAVHRKRPLPIPMGKRWWKHCFSAGNANWKARDSLDRSVPTSTNCAGS